MTRRRVRANTGFDTGYDSIIDGDLEVTGTIRLASGSELTSNVAGQGLSLAQDLDMRRNRIIELGAPINQGDVVNKLYVDQAVANIPNTLTVDEQQLASDLSTILNTENLKSVSESILGKALIIESDSEMLLLREDMIKQVDESMAALLASIDASLSDTFIGIEYLEDDVAPYPDMMQSIINQTNTIDRDIFTNLNAAVSVSQDYMISRIRQVKNNAPQHLDTLKELGTAIQNKETTLSTTLLGQLAFKADTATTNAAVATKALDAEVVHYTNNNHFNRIDSNVEVKQVNAQMFIGDGSQLTGMTDPNEITYLQNAISQLQTDIEAIDSTLGEMFANQFTQFNRSKVFPTLLAQTSNDWTGIIKQKVSTFNPLDTASTNDPFSMAFQQTTMFDALTTVGSNDITIKIVGNVVDGRGGTVPGEYSVVGKSWQRYRGQSDLDPGVHIIGNAIAGTGSMVGGPPPLSVWEPYSATNTQINLDTGIPYSIFEFRYGKMLQRWGDENKSRRRFEPLTVLNTNDPYSMLFQKVSTFNVLTTGQELDNTVILQGSLAAGVGSTVVGDYSQLGGWQTVKGLSWEHGGTLDKKINNPNIQVSNSGDQFGYSVENNENYIVVSAPFEEETDTLGNVATNTGVIYVYDSTGSNLIHTLRSPRKSIEADLENNKFGVHMALNGHLLLVWSTLNANAGEGYLFNLTTGNVIHTFANPDIDGSVTGDFNDYQDKAASLSPSWSLIGAASESIDGLGTGKAYLFDNATGALMRSFSYPLTPAGQENFGHATALTDDYAVIAAPNDTANNGSVHVFDAATGALAYSIFNPSSHIAAYVDSFGKSLHISGNYLFVGASTADVEGGDSGRVYAYNLTTGELLYTILDPNYYSSTSSDLFGKQITSSGNMLYVSAPGEDRDDRTNLGVVYSFDIATGYYTGRTWNPNTAYSGTGYGAAISASGNTLVVGHVLDSEVGALSGAAYIYTLGDLTILTPRGGIIQRFGDENRIVRRFKPLTTTNTGTGEGALDPFSMLFQKVSTFDALTTSPAMLVSENVQLVGNITNGVGSMTGEFSKTATWTPYTTESSNDVNQLFVTFDSNRTNPVKFDNWFDYTTKTDIRPQFYYDRSILGYKPTDGVSDYLGTSIATSDNYIAVGAPGNKTTTTSGSAGSVYIYNRQGAYLRGINNPGGWDGNTNGDYFGNSVAISGDLLIVGAPYDYGNGGSGAGTIHFYNIPDGTYYGALYSPITNSAFFGSDIAVEGTTLVCGVPQADAGGITNLGNVYVYDITNPSSPSLLRTLTRPVSMNNGYFGNSVDISNGYIIVGAPGYNDPETGAQGAGRAYIFNADTGTQLAEFTNGNGENLRSLDQFGFKVAISGNHAVVTAPYHQGPGDNTTEASQSGVAYVYKTTNGQWTDALVTQFFYNPNVDGTGASDNFGLSLAMYDNYAIIGAPYETSNNGTQLNSGAAYIYDVSSGLLLHTLINSTEFGKWLKRDAWGNPVIDGSGNYVYEYQGTTYARVDSSGTYVRDQFGNYIYDANIATQDKFGSAVAIDNGRVIVGAPMEDSRWGHANEINSGAVYFYDFIIDDQKTPEWGKILQRGQNNKEFNEITGYTQHQNDPFSMAFQNLTQFRPLTTNHGALVNDYTVVIQGNATNGTGSQVVGDYSQTTPWDALTTRSGSVILDQTILVQGNATAGTGSFADGDYAQFGAWQAYTTAQTRTDRSFGIQNGDRNPAQDSNWTLVVAADVGEGAKDQTIILQGNATNGTGDAGSYAQLSDWFNRQTWSTSVIRKALFSPDATSSYTASDFGLFPRQVEYKYSKLVPQAYTTVSSNDVTVKLQGAQGYVVGDSGTYTPLNRWSFLTTNGDSKDVQILIQGNATNGTGDAGSYANLSSWYDRRATGVSDTRCAIYSQDTVSPGPEIDGAYYGRAGVRDWSYIQDQYRWRNTFEIRKRFEQPGWPDNVQSNWATVAGSYAVATRAGIFTPTTTFRSDKSAVGGITYAVPGTYYWTCPTGVTRVNVVAIGGGGGGHQYGSYARGAGGGGLGYRNNIAVTPGQTYTIVVGAGGNRSTYTTSRNATNGGTSYFIDTSIVAGYGGTDGSYNSSPGVGGSYTGDGGGRGGYGGYGYVYAGGGGGAGGYTGSGGNGYRNSTTVYYGSGTSGSGGAGGGGGSCGPDDGAGHGGGTGPWGIGSSGSAGSGSSADGYNGYGGSDGLRGGANVPYPYASTTTRGGTSSYAYAGWPGGGGGGADNSNNEAGNGAGGAVRIIYGEGTEYPSAKDFMSGHGSVQSTVQNAAWSTSSQTLTRNTYTSIYYARTNNANYNTPLMMYPTNNRTFDLNKSVINILDFGSTNQRGTSIAAMPAGYSGITMQNGYVRASGFTSYGFWTPTDWGHGDRYHYYNNMIFDFRNLDFSSYLIYCYNTRMYFSNCKIILRDNKSYNNYNWSGIISGLTVYNESDSAAQAALKEISDAERTRQLLL